MSEIQKNTNEVASFLNRVKNQEQSYSKGNTHSSNPTIVHNHYHHDSWGYSWWPWSWHSRPCHYDCSYPTYRPCSLSKKDDKDNKDSLAVVAGVAAIFGGMVYFYNSVYNFLDSSFNLNQTHQIEKINNENFNDPELKQLIQRQKPIDKTRYEKEAISTVTSAGMLTSGAVLAIEGACALPPFSALGTLGLVASVSAKLFNHFYHYNDDKFFQLSIKENIEQAKILERKYQLNLG